MHHFPGTTVHKDRHDLKNLRNMLPFLWDYRGRALFALTCLVLSKVANVGIPLILKQLVDDLQAQSIAGVAILPVSLLLAYGALKLANSLFNELRDVIFARVRYRAMRNVSRKVLKHLYDLSLRFHLQRKSGAIGRDMDRGARSISSILNYMVFSIIPMLVEFTLVAFVLLGNYEPLFAIIAFATVAVYFGFTLAVTEWRMEYRHQMNNLDSEAGSHAMDGLLNYETVKYFGNEDLELKRYDDTLAKWEEVAVKSQSSMSLLNFGQGTIIAAGVTLIMFFAADRVTQGAMTLGDLVLVNGFMLQLFIPLGFLGIVYRQIKYSLADMDRVFKLLEEKPEISDAPDAVDMHIREASIQFNHVDFFYNPDRQILYDVDFSVAAGHTLAIVGASGSGKSTIARLLYRFYDVNQGSIGYDHQSLASVTQQSLRKNIGIVPQDTVLFNDSIGYNIRYGKPDASDAEVQQAAALAHIAPFIDALPQAYDTLVGERGLKLSGGEKQRVAIARAILKAPEILIFDEATSSLDSHTEKAIQATLKEVSRKTTTILIAHRLSTIVDADQIIVMRQGRIIEQGQHQSLLQQQGHYYAMWQLQQKQAEEKSDDS